MKIKLLNDVHLGLYRHGTPNHYNKGTILEVEPADNLPNDSEIRFWITQDGWQDDSYGFPVYKDTLYEVVED